MTRDFRLIQRRTRARGLAYAVCNGQPRCRLITWLQTSLRICNTIRRRQVMMNQCMSVYDASVLLLYPLPKKLCAFDNVRKCIVRTAHPHFLTGSRHQGSVPFSQAAENAFCAFHNLVDKAAVGALQTPFVRRLFDVKEKQRCSSIRP